MATSGQLGLHPSFAVVPFLSSSLNLFYAFIQPTIFLPWVRCADTDLDATNHAFRIWFNHFLAPGVSTICTVTIPTIVAGTYAIAKLPFRTNEWTLYAAGTAFTLAHFIYAPIMLNVLFHVCDEENEKTNGNIEWLKKWLRIHAWRMVLTDVPSIICFGLLVFRSK